MFDCDDKSIIKTLSHRSLITHHLECQSNKVNFPLSPAFPSLQSFLPQFVACISARASEQLLLIVRPRLLQCLKHSLCSPGCLAPFLTKSPEENFPNPLKKKRKLSLKPNAANVNGSTVPSPPLPPTSSSSSSAQPLYDRYTSSLSGPLLLFHFL